MTHCQRILAILDDGEWHEKSEFYGFCVLHSRVSELRNKLGYTIAKKHKGGKVFYRLVSGPLDEAAVAAPIGAGRPAASSSGSDAGSSSPLPERRSAPDQLLIWEAA